MEMNNKFRRNLFIFIYLKSFTRNRRKCVFVNAFIFSCIFSLITKFEGEVLERLSHTIDVGASSSMSGEVVQC